MGRIVLIVSLVLAAMGGNLSAEPNAGPRLITVTGEGRATAAPDMVTLAIGVTHTNKDARLAMQAVSDDVSRILARLGDQGIEPRDMQTSQLTLSPLWSSRSSSSKTGSDITGFSASNVVRVRLRDLSRLGDVLERGLRDGANEFNGLRFGLQDPKPLADAARQAAVRDAMDRAALLAETAGVPLGPVQSITDQGGAPRPQMMEMAASRSGGGAVAAGEVEVEARVTMVFAIGG